MEDNASYRSSSSSQEDDEVLDLNVGSDLDAVEKSPSTDNDAGDKEVTLHITIC